MAVVQKQRQQIMLSARKEGLSFTNGLYWINVSNPQFIKCQFSLSAKPYTINATIQNAQMINCIIRSFSGTSCSNTRFINSVIFSLYGSGSVVNCIVKQYPTLIENFYIANSILYCNTSHSGSGYHGVDNAATVFHSIGVMAVESGDNRPHADYFDTTDAPNHNLYNMYDMDSIFRTFNDVELDNAPTEGLSFELLDNIATMILGDDGTQVGIYGGPYPFTPSVRNPRIRRSNVAQRATPDNKLSVDIEVVSE